MTLKWTPWNEKLYTFVNRSVLEHTWKLLRQMYLGNLSKKDHWHKILSLRSSEGLSMWTIWVTLLETLNLISSVCKSFYRLTEAPYPVSNKKGAHTTTESPSKCKTLQMQVSMQQLCGVSWCVILLLMCRQMHVWRGRLQCQSFTLGPPHLQLWKLLQLFWMLFKFKSFYVGK